MWRTYTTLTDVEAVFRSLKSELGLRPIYHRKPARADGHLFITATFRRPDGRTLHVRTATQAELDQRAIYDALGVDPHPGGVRKTLV